MGNEFTEKLDKLHRMLGFKLGVLSAIPFGFVLGFLTCLWWFLSGGCR